MFFFESLIGDVVVFFVVYKILDRLIRIPRIGNFSDRYILVTGCDSGFGNLLAKRLDGLGCHVFAGCLTEKGEMELKKVSSQRLHAISLDVANQESVRKAFDYVKSQLPRGRGLWGVMNNAGVYLSSGHPDWLKPDDYRRECDVNLWGLIDVTLTFLPLVKAEKGRVVNTSSMCGRFSVPVVAPYTISKYGVQAFTDALRRSLEPFGCKALLIEPGIYRTNLMSAENYRNRFQTTFNNASPEIRAEYGEDYVNKFEMFFFESLIGDVVVFFVVYKILDRLIRIPRIGNYSDRYILVTGCDMGFGNLLARRLDGMGCHVFAGFLTEKGETELKKVSSQRLHSISLDVANRESVRKAFDYVKSKLPRGRGLWGVMNNAGVFLSNGPPEWSDLDDYKRQCDVNLWGLIDVTLTFLPLVKAEKGRVVNTSSIAGRFSFPVATPYGISKYGVQAFTDALRRSLVPFSCKALLIEPGIHRTNLMSAENVRSRFQTTFNNASPEVRAEYGENYINKLLLRRPRLSIMKGSERFSDVVDAYEHALLGLYPRARYLVGSDAWLFVFLQTLPEWIGDWVFNNLLYVNTALPAACAKK